MIAEITYINGIVSLNGNEYQFQEIEIMNETQVLLYLSQGNLFMITANYVVINGNLQTSVEMIADTFNA